MENSEDLLSSLLDIAETELNALNSTKSPTENASSNLRKLSEIDLFHERNDSKCLEQLKKECFGDDLSSDDELIDYSHSGREIKQILTTELKESENVDIAKSNSWKLKNEIRGNKSSTVPPNFEPVFGINIVNPLISSKSINEHLSGREFIPISNIKNQLHRITKESEFVISGVLCTNGMVKTSAKGNKFLSWTLTDLQGEIKTIQVLLFASACTEFKKTLAGTVVALLNPSVLEKNTNSKDQACLSVINPSKVLVLGKSQDFALCSSRRKNGEKCTNIVNKRVCEFCIYHMKWEYQKTKTGLKNGSKGLVELRNKVLGKHEVFYAGKSYTAFKNKKETHLRSDNLPKKKIMDSVHYGAGRRNKDLELIKKLGGNTGKFTEENYPNCEALKPVSSVENQIETAPTSTAPVLFSLKKTGNCIDLNVPLPRNLAKAKFKALQFVEKNGKLSKTDPNSTKAVMKRKIEIDDYGTNPKKLKQSNSNSNEDKANGNGAKENKFYSDRFKKIMELHEKNNECLLKLHDNEKEEKYFNKLELKERLEEKMANTFKLETKAVKCLNCKYTSFSASDKCKAEKHKLKVFDTFKRFFCCKNCKNRITCLDIVPVKPCKNCGDNRWERAAMIKEKIHTNSTSLSIRGGEQEFTNSNVTDSNINLLVPEND